jgi:transposase
MIVDWNTVKMFIKPGSIDFRKQINGLSAHVANQMKKDVFSGAFYIFASRDRKKIKIIYWDKNGFCLWQKRLEKDRFPWPINNNEAMELAFDEFKMLLSGIDFFKAHQEIKGIKIF